MHRRWVVSRTNADYVSYLAKTASISPVFAQILIGRGIKTASAVHDFLKPGVTKFSDPFELSGILEAVERIRVACKNGECVMVHGDYDADGLTATSIMVSALHKAGVNVHYFIPSRITHGYGFNIAGVDAAHRIGAKLIITVDCGIGSFEAADYARRLGIDVIITDHHEPTRSENADSLRNGSTQEELVTRHSSLVTDFKLPYALSIINPKLHLKHSELNILSGAGIAFKLAHAMALDRDIPFSEDDLFPMLDLAALGTVADVVPLTGENRVIVKEAMQYIQSSNRPGIRALKQAAGIESRQIRAGSLSFSLVPRINAAGRIADAQDVVRLFLSGSDSEAEELASWLNGLNSERQQIEELVYTDALDMLKGSKPDSVVVLAKEGWHLGVLGIVASKIAETFHLPAFIFSIEDGMAKGSCRSVASFDICRGLDECRDLLVSHGGHKQAAGVKLRVGDLPQFENRMRMIIKRDITAQALQPELEIHAHARLNEIGPALMLELDLLEPFGNSNPEPVLGARDLYVIGPRLVGTRHLKLKLKNGSVLHDAIGFNMGSLIDDLSPSIRVDAAFCPSYNEWNNKRYLQLVLKGLRPGS